jgi:energy-coupling factor transporter ATP-binding protein EcfA2
MKHVGNATRMRRDAHERGSLLFAVDRLSKHFGRIAALTEASFSVRAGEVLGLIGPNGAGKTTLFECLAGVLPKAWLDGALALGTEPAAGRGAPNPDLSSASNPVLRPPMAGKVGLWSKTDSTSYFKDFVINPQP